MEFSIKTILRILFVLSCASLQAGDYANTDPRPKDLSKPNTNPMPNQENQ